MNDLSWMIYWAGVVESLSAVIGTIFFGGLAACVIAGFGIILWSADGGWNKDPDGEACPRSALTLVGKVCAGLMVFGVLASFIPGKDTLYGIAASQAGEQVMKSETGAKAMKALNAWLDKQSKE